MLLHAKRYSLLLFLIPLLYGSKLFAVYEPVPITLYNHNQDQWQLIYTYYLHHYSGTLDHTHEVSNRKVLREFQEVTKKRIVQRHEFLVAYLPYEDWKLTLMVPYVHIHANVQQRNGSTFNMTSHGIGDAVLTGSYMFYDVLEHQIWFYLGFSFPTGSISAHGQTPAGFQQLPYTMQLGSGTFDMLPSLLYKARSHWWFWEFSGGGTARWLFNDKHYKWGPTLFAKAWAARQLTEWGATVSLGVIGNYWGSINGRDPDLNPEQIPDSDPHLMRGIRVDALPALFVTIPKGLFKDMQLGIEGILPFFQYLIGPQTKLKWGADVFWYWYF